MLCPFFNKHRAGGGLRGCPGQESWCGVRGPLPGCGVRGLPGQLSGAGCFEMAFSPGACLCLPVLVHSSTCNQQEVGLFSS